MAKPSATTLLLCATRFWALRHAPLTPTLRRGVRRVVLKQGVRPAAIDQAERTLIKRGLIKKAISGSAIALTEKGLRVTGRACPRIDLPPWDNRAVYQR